MPARFDLGKKPHLGYTDSVVDRAAHLRHEPAALEALACDSRARTFVVGGEFVVLRKGAPLNDPAFALAFAGALAPQREQVFLGLHDGAPLFAVAIDPEAVEALKRRDDLLVTDLRSIATGGLVAGEYLPSLAEAKALLAWHGRHRFCSKCGSPTQMVNAGWRRDCPVFGT
jgi:NAD+ diphosphatase